MQLELTATRTQAATTLQTRLVDEVKELHLHMRKSPSLYKTTPPQDELDHTAFGDHGLDSVEIELTTNKGESLKTTCQSRKWWEMSRVMLDSNRLAASIGVVDNHF